MDKRELETLCNDFNNAGHLLSVMSRSALEQSAYLDVTMLKNYHQEMFCALAFVADALKTKSNSFWSFLEEFPDAEEESNPDSGGGKSGRRKSSSSIPPSGCAR